MAEILRIGTINIAVSSAQEAGTRFEELGLGALKDGLIRLEAPPAQIRYHTIPIGGSSLSVVEPSDPQSPIARFLDRRGEGIFSINLVVDDLDGVMVAWRERGVEWVLDTPLEFGPSDERPYGGRVNWTKPPSLYNVLFELTEISS